MESKLFGLFIKYTIKNEFNILKINIFFSFEILKKVDKGPRFVSSSLLREGLKSNFFRDNSGKIKLFVLFIKHTNKNELNILKINIFFSLEILKKVDKGPSFVSSSLQKYCSKSNFFRDILAKVNSLDFL